jgi:DNA-binding transcriptional ArsR family regulator
LLDSLVTSKTRVKLLLKFFAHSNSGYLRSLAKDFEESTNSVRVELNRLAEAGILVIEDEGKTKVYRANDKHPFHEEIKNMVSKFLGLDEIMERIVKRMGEVERAYIIGDYAMGIDSGTIEMILIGKNLDTHYLDYIKDKTYEKINRKVSVQVFEKDPSTRGGILVYGI